MRFASVPLSYPVSDGQREEKQVWFATTSDPDIVSEKDEDKRKELLLKAFSSWHDPIQAMMESTPAKDIMMEGAIAHKHCVGPVSDVHRLLREIHRKAPPSSGPGPVMVFVGDSFMTVDPILAQGFTMALEGSHALLGPIETACQTHELSDLSIENNLAFDPYILRQNLQERHDRRNHRLVSLLRATELVQALGQPQASLFGSLFKNIVRPAMMMTPNAIKAPIFNAMLKYSLGK
jgi:2-polyprenyl-6-methoxyphenol hydroxylase-like FAD-dependent oxidoreductase